MIGLIQEGNVKFYRGGSYKNQKVKMEHSQEFNIPMNFDLADVYKDGLFYDCTVEVAGKSFKTHRVLLAGSSKYFYEKFKDGMTTELSLGDAYDAKCFGLFINFLYTRKITVTLANLNGLLKIAYNLEITTLFNLINDFLHTVANPDTAILLLRNVSFALSKLPRFMKFCATLVEKTSPTTDFAFMAPPEFKILIKKARFSSGYVRDEIIERYCKARCVDQKEFDEFKRFDPALPDTSIKKQSFSAVCLAAPPDPGLFKRLAGSVEVEASGSLNGRDPHTLIEEDPIKHWFTESDGNAWVLFEFKDLYIQPTHYAIWSHGGSSTLRNWAFQASNDRTNWVVLSTHNNDESLKEPFSQKEWPLDTNGYFKYFRIIQTGFNWSGNRWLYLQKVEIWGVACSKDKF